MPTTAAFRYEVLEFKIGLASYSSSVLPKSWQLFHGTLRRHFKGSLTHLPPVTDDR